MLVCSEDYANDPDDDKDRDCCLEFRKCRKVHLEKENAKTYLKRIRIEDFIRLPGVVVWDTFLTLPTLPGSILRSWTSLAVLPIEVPGIGDPEYPARLIDTDGRLYFVPVSLMASVYWQISSRKEPMQTSSTDSGRTFALLRKVGGTAVALVASRLSLET